MVKFGRSLCCILFTFLLFSIEISSTLASSNRAKRQYSTDYYHNENRDNSNRWDDRRYRDPVRTNYDNNDRYGRRPVVNKDLRGPSFRTNYRGDYSYTGNNYDPYRQEEYGGVGYYNPEYIHNLDEYRLEDYNPYEFNKIDGKRKDRRPKEYQQQATRPPVDVQTKLGKVSGYQVFLYDGPQVPLEDRPGHQTFDKMYRNVTVFKGIPYAERPVRDNRFKPPKPYINNWGSIDGRKFGPVCPQANEYIGKSKGNLLVNEDCLYLNIYTPSAREGLRDLYPVMIYIHGGFFSHGSANRFPAHMLAASMDVVVVTFNYRLGVLGFLSTADEVSPGNYGLLDQAMAIRWISDNITPFNGDRSRITLFGPGAGAASAGLHSLSSRTKDAFHRIIAQSGSMLAEWAVTADYEFLRNTTRIYGEKVGCTSSSSHSLVNCLKSRKPAELVNADLKPQVGWLPWTPVIDWHTQRQDERFLKDIPERLIKGNFDMKKDLDYMCGLTTEEAALMILNDKDLQFKNYDIDEAVFKARVRTYIDMYNYTLNPKGVFNAINFMYTPWSDPSNRTLIRENYIQMLTDSYFVAPVVKLNRLLVDNQIKPYMYVLNSTLDSINKPKWHGVPHDTEYLFITGAPFMDSEFYPDDYELENVKWTDADRNMSEFIMRTWTNFAKHGNPNLPTNSFGINWEPMSFGNLQYLSLNTTNNTYSVMQRDYKEREAAFWTEYIPQLIGRVLPTWAPTEEPWHEERKVIRAALWGTAAAGALFFILMMVCCGLYCGKKRKPNYMDEDQLPHYHAPYIVGTEKNKYFEDEVTVNPIAVKKEQQTSV